DPANCRLHGIEPANDLIAYFCMEYGLHESVPLYSGGLGVLAGDHCKAAADLGLPFVAIGLMYRQGYFHQHVTRDGEQREHYLRADPDELPLRAVTGADGGEIHVALD